MTSSVRCVRANVVMQSSEVSLARSARLTRSKDPAVLAVEGTMSGILTATCMRGHRNIQGTRIEFLTRCATIVGSDDDERQA